MQPTPQAPNQPVQQAKQSKWLLPIAIVIALLVVVIYNAHINAVINGSKKPQVKVVKFVKPIKPGQRLKRNAIEPQLINKEAFTDQFIKYNDIDRYLAGNGAVIRNVKNVGSYLRAEDLLNYSRDTAADRLPANDIRMVNIQIDPNSSLGDALTPHSYIEVRGTFKLPGKKENAYFVFERVKVANIAGIGAAPGADKKRFNRNFKTIGIELPKDVILQLDNLKTHMIGNFRISLMNPRVSVANENKINPILMPLTKSSALDVPASRRGNLAPRRKDNSNNPVTNNNI